MAQKPRRLPRHVCEKEQNQTLKKLKRLYGGTERQPDLFGRRPALPSEIEKLVKRNGN